MKYAFYDELETMATYPLALLTKEERTSILSHNWEDPARQLDDGHKNKIASQIDTFFDENEQFLSEHVHEVRVIESLIKLREKCNSLGIPWEKSHIVKMMKKVIGRVKPDDALFANLPNDFLLPFLLNCADNIQDLKNVAHNNSRMRDVMSDPKAIRKLCLKPFHEWGVSGVVAVDYLTEFATHVPDLHLDLSFTPDLDNQLLSKLAKSCPNLIAVNLSGCSGISGEGLEAFATNHQLRHLYCFDCPHIAERDMAHLRSLLPLCSIFG